MSSVNKAAFLVQAFNFEGYTLFRRSDGIIHIQFKEGFCINLPDAIHIVKTIKGIKKKEEKCLFLVEFKHDNTFSMETREFISSDAVSDIIKADAFVIKGLALQILGQGYLKINKPKRPTRLFKSEELASRWLLLQ